MIHTEVTPRAGNPCSPMTLKLFAERNLYVDWTETRPSHV